MSKESWTIRHPTPEKGREPSSTSGDGPVLELIRPAPVGERSPGLRPRTESLDEAVPGHGRRVWRERTSRVGMR